MAVGSDCCLGMPFQVKVQTSSNPMATILKKSYSRNEKVCCKLIIYSFQTFLVLKVGIHRFLSQAFERYFRNNQSECWHYQKLSKDGNVTCNCFHSILLRKKTCLYKLVKKRGEYFCKNQELLN